MTDYDGKDRRRASRDTDHDLLIDINNKLHNMVDIYGRHVDDDVKIFDDHEDRIRFLERGFFIGMGALGLLQIALKFFFK